MDPLAIAQNIYQLASVIYVQAKKVNANQERCVLLSERVAVVESAIRKLGKLPDQEAFCQSLKRLEACLQEVVDYMTELSGQRWFQKFIRAKSHESAFEDFNQRLTLAISELSLGLDAQALLNREADQKALKADQAVLLAKQDDIVRLNEALLAKVNKIPDEGFFRRQEHSLRLRLDQIFQMMQEIKSPPALLSPKSAAAALDAKIAIPYFELSLEEKIGQGTFGTIYRGRWHEEEVAIKLWSGRLSERERPQFIRETQILQRLNTPAYVPKFYGACLEEGQACVVMEYCPQGSLDARLNGPALPPVQQRAIALSLAKSLAYLHQREVIHRYLKSTNVLLKEASPGGLLQARVTGFGLSKTQYPSIVSAQLDLQALTAGLAPEVLAGHEASLAADVFSFGVILKETLIGCRALSNIEDGLNGLDPKYAELIRSCSANDPKQRPDIKAVVETLTALTPPVVLKLEASGLALPAAVVPDRPRSPTPASREGKLFLTPPSPVKRAIESAAQPATPAAAAVRSEIKTPSKAAAAPMTPLSPDSPKELTAYGLAKHYHSQKDYGNARKYYEEALSQGEDKVQVKLAALLIRGDGGAPETKAADQQRAVALFKAAAARNEKLALENLLKVYKHGVSSIVADPLAAAEWEARLRAVVSNPAQSALHPAVTPQIRSGQVSQASPLTLLGAGAKASPAPSAASPSPRQS